MVSSFYYAAFIFICSMPCLFKSVNCIIASTDKQFCIISIIMRLIMCSFFIVRFHWLQRLFFIDQVISIISPEQVNRRILFFAQDNQYIRGFFGVNGWLPLMSLTLWFIKLPKWRKNADVNTQKNTLLVVYFFPIIRDLGIGK